MRRPWIAREDFFNSHGTMRTSGRRGLEKLRGERVFGASSCVIFLEKGRKSIGRWWKGGEWVESLGSFKE
jgi:hypothetical protein